MPLHLSKKAIWKKWVILVIIVHWIARELQQQHHHICWYGIKGKLWHTWSRLKKKKQCNQNSLGRSKIKSLELLHTFISFSHIFLLLPPHTTIYLLLENKELFRAALLAVLSLYNRSMLHCISKYYLKVNTSHKCTDWFHFCFMICSK